MPPPPQLIPVMYMARKLADSQVFEAGKKLSSEPFELQQIAVQYPFAPQEEIFTADRFNVDDRLATLSGNHIQFLKRIRFSFAQDASILVERREAIHPGQSPPNSQQTWYDIVHITPCKSGTIHFDEIMRFVLEARSLLGVFDPSGTLADQLSEEMKAFYAAREVSLQRLEAVNAEFLASSERLRVDMEVRLRDRQDEQDRLLREKERAMEVVFAAERSELDTIRTNLNARASDLDDRDNTHVRRATYETIKGKLAERSRSFELTTGTRHLRWWPWVTTGVFLLLLLFGAFYFGRPDASSPSAFGWLAIARQILFTTAAGVVFTFLIRMQQRWFQRHADEEFRLKRLDLDIDRATWLVELALEWKEKKDDEMPKELVDKLGHNLFADIGEHEADIHPLETALSSIIGNSGKLVVKSPTLEVSVDRDAK